MAARYRAFLSYSHRDSRFAERFHADLENWKADRGLLGRETPRGPVPRSLRPVFRDRDDFAGGATLSAQTEAALRQSDFMILLCSPDAARSPYVNEEIRLFKAMGGADRIIPVIIAGAPGGAGDDCFPPALLRQVDADGRLTDAIDEPLAADARDEGDGPRRALAKVIAGLLGVPFDEIVRRAERAERRRQRIVAAVAVVMGLLAATAGGMAWLAEMRRAEAEHNYRAALQAADSLLGDVGEELIRTEGVSLATTKRLLDRAENIYDELIEALPDAAELRLSKAAALAVFAKAYSAKGDLAEAAASLEAAERLLTDAVAAGVAQDADRVLLAMIRARRGAQLASTGDRPGAIARLSAAVEGFDAAGADALANPGIAFEAASAGLMLARIRLIEGDGAGSATAEAAAARILDRWSDEAGDDLRWIAARVNHLELQASSLADAGDEAGALARLERAEALLGEVIRRAPDMPQAPALLAGVKNSVIDRLEALGRTADAEAERQARDALLAEIAAGDRENRQAAMRAAAATVRTAAADLAAAGATSEARTEALGRLTDALATVEDAAAAEPDDLEARLTRQIALRQSASALLDAGLDREARDVAARGLAAAEADVRATPGDMAARLRLAAALGRLAEAQEGAGALEEALAVRRRELALAEDMAAADPGLRRNVAYAHGEAGRLLWTLSRRAEAIPHYRARAAILDELASAPDASADLAPLRAWTYLNLGELAALTGDGAGARTAFVRCREIAAAALAAAPDDRYRLIDLAWAEARMAQIGEGARARWPEVERLLVRADAMAPLEDLEDELLTVARIAQGAAH